MRKSDQYDDYSDGECKDMSISGEQLLFGAELLLCDGFRASSPPTTDSDAEKSEPEAPKPETLKRSLEFFAAKPSDSSKEPSADTKQSSTEANESSSDDEAETPEDGRKKLRAALSGSQGSLVNIDTLEDFSKLNF